jgi:hypothetical protein
LVNRYSESNVEIKPIEEDISRYFPEFFENLFAMKHNDRKIIKCYFEMKNCFQKLGLLIEAYKIIEKCYSSYKEDVAVIYEMLKQSIMISNFQRAEEAFGLIKHMYLQTVDEKYKTVYENYMNFSE